MFDVIGASFLRRCSCTVSNSRRLAASFAGSSRRRSQRLL
jgi:hypothetical protein